MSLHEGIRSGNEELAASLVENGASVNDKDENSDTPLHIAAWRGIVSTTLLLLQRGADKDSRNRTQETPLLIATRALNAPVVRALMEAGADATLCDDGGRTPISWAAHRSCFASHGKESVAQQIAQTLIGFGVAPNLREAILLGYDELAASLVEDGVSPDKSFQGETPLYTAASAGSAGITQLLLWRGDNKDFGCNSREETPLHAAAARCHPAVVRVLMEAGVDTSRLERYGKTPLISAVYFESLDVVETMIELGINVDEPGDDGWTPLHEASDVASDEGDGSRLDFINVLVAAGASVNARDSSGSTPLSSNLIQIKVVRSLVNHGADVNTQDEDGNTPLHNVIAPDPDYPAYAVDLDIVERVDFLLKAGADETVVDSEGKTAMMLSMAPSRGDARDQIEHARELLASAPADRVDRRWGRRALLIMCVARHCRGDVQMVDGAAGSTNDNWARMAAWVLDAGLEPGKQGIFQAVVGYM